MSDNEEKFIEIVYNKRSKPEVKLNIVSEEIRASNRQLKAVWTKEAQEDLMGRFRTKWY